MRDMVSIGEAATILKVSPDTVRRHIRQGKLTAEKVRTAQGYRWQVALDAHVDAMDNAYVNALLERIASLENELEARRVEVQQLHALLHQKALPAPSWWQRLFKR